MEFFEEAKDNIMLECRKDDLAWESSVRLTLVGSSEDIGMYLEEREGRKRKWQGDGKMMRREEGDEREQRKVPPKKIMGE
ncbi:jg2613 [Pararge aegeria aegeria]|uniref:Jg2613 protein n=1 Tax=Pararge aegeria aegeria TaxID=348720 RepID=A0A8S4QI78_9NEOP|nr:jg2613 [Pararge aegeria aegeria]